MGLRDPCAWEGALSGRARPETRVWNLHELAYLGFGRVRAGCVSREGPARTEHVNPSPPPDSTAFVHWTEDALLQKRRTAPIEAREDLVRVGGGFLLTSRVCSGPE